MAEAKKEVEHIAGIKPDDGKEYLHTSIGFERGADTKYEVYWLVPKTDEEAQNRYNCTLQDLVTSGVRQLSTRPDYKEVGFDADGNLQEPKTDEQGNEIKGSDGHSKMQELADGYKVGARVVGESVKSKAKELDQMKSEFGNVDEIKAKLAQYEELKAKGLI